MFTNNGAVIDKVNSMGSAVLLEGLVCIDDFDVKGSVLFLQEN